MDCRARENRPGVRVQFTVEMRSVPPIAFCLGIVLLLSATGVADSAPAPELKRIAVVPLRDEGNVRDGAARLTSMLQAKLAARFEGVEFFIVEPAADGLPPGPLLLEEAIELCRESGADALLDGVFGGVEIVGGSWPNNGGDHPQAKGFLRWRLVDGTDGLLIQDGVIDPDKHKVYPQRIRSTKELQSRVMQDLAAQVVTALEDCERLPGGGDAGD